MIVTDSDLNSTFFGHVLDSNSLPCRGWGKHSDVLYKSVDLFLVQMVRCKSQGLLQRLRAKQSPPLYKCDMQIFCVHRSLSLCEVKRSYSEALTEQSRQFGDIKAKHVQIGLTWVTTCTSVQRSTFTEDPLRKRFCTFYFYHGHYCI